MRILLDECLPARLRRALPDHDVHTVQSFGCAGTKNGELLLRARENGFTVFVTVDRNLAYQQDLPGIGLAIVALRARTNDIADLLPLMPDLLALLPSVTPGHVTKIPA